MTFSLFTPLIISNFLFIHSFSHLMNRLLTYPTSCSPFQSFICNLDHTNIDTKYYVFNSFLNHLSMPKFHWLITTHNQSLELIFAKHYPEFVHTITNAANSKCCTYMLTQSCHEKCARKIFEG